MMSCLQMIWKQDKNTCSGSLKTQFSKSVIRNEKILLGDVTKRKEKKSKKCIKTPPIKRLVVSARFYLGRLRWCWDNNVNVTYNQWCSSQLNMGNTSNRMKGQSLSLSNTLIKHISVIILWQLSHSFSFVHKQVKPNKKYHRNNDNIGEMHPGLEVSFNIFYHNHMLMTSSVPVWFSIFLTTYTHVLSLKLLCIGCLTVHKDILRINNWINKLNITLSYLMSSLTKPGLWH